MKVSAIQTRENIRAKYSKRWQDAWEDMQESLYLTERAAVEGSHLIVTIETSNSCGDPGDPAMRGEVAQLNRRLFPVYEELSERTACCIAAGLYTVREDRLFNSVVLFDCGAVAGVFDKVHLPAGEEVGVTPGSEFSVFSTSVGKVGPMVCWDMQFPESGRILSMKGAEILVCPTWGWENIYRCRAYENSVPMVAAMGVPESGRIWEFCAPSCVVDNMGNILAQGEMDRTGIVSAELEPGAEPAPQYGSGEITGKKSMREIRLSQRRPDVYGYLCEERPAVWDRYQK